MTTDDSHHRATRPPIVARGGTARAAGASAATAVDYAMTGGRLFAAALRGALLLVPTLGLHRFWMITRLRRMIWASIRVDGEPLEYTGRATELALGFLIAVVVLALILGGANLALVFAGLVGGVDLGLAFNASLPLLVPLGYYARYRARRYLAARTRWRGLRFGMEAGAVGYALHATGHALLTLLTLGVLYPRQHVLLARRQRNATWYGNVRFRQEADWRDLLGPWLAAWLLPLVVVAGSLNRNWTALAALGGPAELEPRMLEAVGQAALNVAGTAFGALVFVWPLWRRYQAAAERVLTAGLSLGPARFDSTLRTGALLRVDLRSALSYLGVLLAAGTVAAAMAAGAIASVGQAGGGAEAIFATAPASVVILVAVGWLAFFAPLVALGWLTGLHWPLAARLEALTVTGADRLADARQRADDPAREGGGFADALDVGAGF